MTSTRNGFLAQDQSRLIKVLAHGHHCKGEDALTFFVSILFILLILSKCAASGVCRDLAGALTKQNCVSVV